MKLINISIRMLLVLYSLGTQAQEIRVALASSLVPPFTEIAKEYESINGVKIELIPAASATLTHQVINGAPFDLFVSANPAYCDKLGKEMGIKSSDFPIKGRLALWTAAEIDTSGFAFNKALIKTMLDPNTKTIAIANPDIAPYGQLAKEFLQSLGIWFDIQEKIITGNSISLTNQFINTTSADLVFTSYSSSVIMNKSTKGFWYDLSKSTQKSTSHCISILKKKEEVKSFYSFLLSQESMVIFKKYGYK